MGIFLCVCKYTTVYYYHHTMKKKHCLSSHKYKFHKIQKYIAETLKSSHFVIFFLVSLSMCSQTFGTPMFISVFSFQTNSSTFTHFESKQNSCLPMSQQLLCMISMLTIHRAERELFFEVFYATDRHLGNELL